MPSASACPAAQLQRLNNGCKSCLPAQPAACAPALPAALGSDRREERGTDRGGPQAALPAAPVEGPAPPGDGGPTPPGAWALSLPPCTHLGGCCSRPGTAWTCACPAPHPIAAATQQPWRLSALLDPAPCADHLPRPRALPGQEPRPSTMPGVQLGGGAALQQGGRVASESGRLQEWQGSKQRRRQCGGQEGVSWQGSWQARCSCLRTGCGKTLTECVRRRAGVNMLLYVSFLYSIHLVTCSAPYMPSYSSARHR